MPGPGLVTHSRLRDRMRNQEDTVYTHLNEIEADYRRGRIAEQYRNAQRRHRRPQRTHQERRWGVARRHTA